MADRIETPSKSQIKRWAKLTMEKYRRREGLFPAEGGKVVAELLRSGRPLEALLVHEEKIDRWEALLAGAPAGVGIYRLGAREWDALSQDGSPEGVMAVAVMTPAVDPESLPDGPGPLLLLHEVNNPNNLGAVLRTADWFGFRTVLDQRRFLRGDQSQGRPDVDGEPVPSHADRGGRFRAAPAAAPRPFPGRGKRRAGRGCPPSLRGRDGAPAWGARATACPRRFWP